MGPAHFGGIAPGRKRIPDQAPYNRPTVGVGGEIRAGNEACVSYAPDSLGRKARLSLMIRGTIFFAVSRRGLTIKYDLELGPNVGRSSYKDFMFSRRLPFRPPARLVTPQKEVAVNFPERYPVPRTSRRFVWGSPR